MCGIAGIVTADGSTPEVGHLRAMTDAISHRGPDGEGFVSKPGFGFGHRRLAVIDLESGAQPMADDTERWWVVFNGEIYNFLELRATLEANGQRFRTKSDTEVLLELVAEQGTAAFSQLRGMFAVALWNATEIGRAHV